jgi:hypothetical protein
MTARKEYFGDTPILVGPDIGDPIGADATCGEWRDPGSRAEVFIAHATSTARWFGGDRQKCNVVADSAHLICLED